MTILRANTISDEEALRLRARFPIFESKRYLNTCSLGPVSDESLAALQEYGRDWARFGAPAWWEAWIPRIEEVRAQFARLIGCTSEVVAIHHSISSALSTVASSIDYTHRRKVIVAELDFPTIAYQWLARSDVEVVFALSNNGVTVPLDEYERLIDDQTAAVATSHVFYATGAVQDVRSIAEIARRRGALSIVDGYHAVGVMPVDVPSLDPDFYLGGTLKWVCGGPGLTFIAVSPRVAPETRPGATGWFAAADQFAFQTRTFAPADTANRFQMGTPAVGTVYAAGPALKLLLDLGMDRVWERDQALTSRLVDHASARGLRLASPLDAVSRGSIVLLQASDPASVVEHLGRQGIIVDARPGKVRLSPHFYNTESDVDEAVEAAARAIRT